MRKLLVSLGVMLFVGLGTSWGWSPELKVSASGYEKGNQPSDAIDQDYSTHWTCRGINGECWLQLDIGHVTESGSCPLYVES